MALLSLAGLLNRLTGQSEDADIPFSIIDPVTRLPTRVAVVQHLRECLSKSHGKRPVGLAIVDFTNVQGIFETPGAGETDLLLRLARLLRSQVPEGHFVGHLRDREFAIVACGVPVSEIEHIADQVIESVRSADSLQAERRFIATIVGIGYSSRADFKAPQLMTLADIALHYARATGRGTHSIVDRIPRSKVA